MSLLPFIYFLNCILLIMVLQLSQFSLFARLRQLQETEIIISNLQTLNLRPGEVKGVRLVCDETEFKPGSCRYTRSQCS